MSFNALQSSSKMPFMWVTSNMHSFNNWKKYSQYYLLHVYGFTLLFEFSKHSGAWNLVYFVRCWNPNISYKVPSQSNLFIYVRLLDGLKKLWLGKLWLNYLILKLKTWFSDRRWGAVNFRKCGMLSFGRHQFSSTKKHKLSVVKTGELSKLHNEKTRKLV